MTPSDPKLPNSGPPYDTLPDFRGGSFKNAKKMIEDTSDLRTEAVQAEADPNVRLSGTGAKDDAWPTSKDGAVSAKLQHIRALLDSLPAGKYSSDSELKWTKDNKEFLAAIGKETGLSPDLIAGILRTEVDEGWVTDAKEKAADWTFGLIRDPDDVSHGLMQVQMDTAAEVLGYDPDDLSDKQRDEIRTALRDPAQNILIAAEYLERLKAETDFADVPADEMTDAQYQELATMYNGDPKYGKEFMGPLNEARKALS